MASKRQISLGRALLTGRVTAQQAYAEVRRPKPNTAQRLDPNVPRVVKPTVLGPSMPIRNVKKPPTVIRQSVEVQSKQAPTLPKAGIGFNRPGFKGVGPAKQPSLGEKRRAELLIASQRVAKGKGTATDKRNLDYAKKKFGYK